MKEGSKVNESSAAVSTQKSSQDGFFLKTSKVLALVVTAFLLASCRGDEFSHQPVHPNMNMDQQNRFEAQEENPFFANNRSMREPVEGTISRGNLRQNPELFQGINEDSSFVANIPVDVDKSFLYRGKDRYEIYCTPCHGSLGDGQGIIMTGRYGFVPAPSFHIDRLRNIEDGYLYSVIANGIRNMPSYAHQIKVEDRWAIVSYVRALQRSQNATEEQLQEYDVDLAGIQQEYTDQQAAEQAQQEAAQGGGGEVSAERGEELYIANGCQACHSRDGSDGIGPTHQNLFGETQTMADGSTVEADEDYLMESIVNPNAKIVEGYDPVMAPYSYLSDSELQSIVEYIKTLSDNQ